MTTRNNRFLNDILYYGLSKEDYKKIEKQAFIINFNSWKWFDLLIALVGLASLYTAIVTHESIASISFRTSISIYSIIVSILFFKAIKPDSRIGQLLIYISGFAVYAMGIVISLQETDLPAVSFIVFLIVVQILIIDKPLKIFIVDIIVIATYLIVAIKFKSESVLITDLTNCIVFGLTGFVCSCYINKVRIREAHTNLKLDEERIDIIQKQKDELEIKTLELEDALQKANEASRAKTTFLFNMSHDIRTPMNAIMGFTDLAIKNIDDKNKALDSLNKTKDSSNHLLNLINDILDMSRIESGKMELSESPVDITNVISNHITMLKTLADKKEINLIINIEKLSNNFVYADHLRLNQALINIVSNAVKYTQEGGTVKYTVYETSNNQDEYQTINFKVEDNGCGMDKDFIPTIFDEFSREKTSTVTKQQGTGLGLAITKRIVDMMNGTILVESELGKGSTFILSIPFKKQLNPDKENQIIISAEIKTENLKGKKCLLVEDNELNREISNEILKDVGLEVETAEDGLIAVEMVKSNGPTYYDFILMDIQMPRMDGYQATNEIRNLFPDVHIPIIALSANAFEEDKKKSLESGMDDHQSKPIVISLLMESIRKLLK